MRHEAICLLIGLALWAMPQTVRAAAALKWEAERITLTPPAGTADIEGVFRFRNQGDTTVRIVEARSSCGCTVAALDRDVYQAGESGSIRARFHVGEREGHQSVTVWVTTDEPGGQVYELALDVKIVVPVRITPRLLHWKVGEEPGPKSIRLQWQEGWRCAGAVVDSDAFTVEVIKTETGGAAELRVTPRDTWATRAGVIKIQLVRGDEPPRDFLAWVRVL